MDERESERWKTRLVALRAALTDIARTSEEASKPVMLDQTSVGRVSRIDAMQAQQMAMEGERRRKDQLMRIEGAMKRIEAGQFGRCFVCAGPIGEARLEIDPTQTRCIGCAS